MFPANKSDLPDELQKYWGCWAGLTVYDGVILINSGTIAQEKGAAGPALAHQGVTGMLLRAELSVFWPGMTADIRETRARCSTCHNIALSLSNMPPVEPVIPAYPFQHICADYFDLHGNYLCDHGQVQQLVQCAPRKGWNRQTGEHHEQTIPGHRRT